jgi:hypothetical protein
MAQVVEEQTQRDDHQAPGADAAGANAGGRINVSVLLSVVQASFS